MKFRLQKVLEHRWRREDELKQRLASAGMARAQAEADLRVAVATEGQRRHELSGMLAGGRVDAGGVQEMGRVLEACGRIVAARQGELARRTAFEQEERARLTQAMLDRKALDTLREHHEARERRESLRKEGALLEEIANARAIKARLAAITAAGR